MFAPSNGVVQRKPLPVACPVAQSMLVTPYAPGGRRARELLGVVARDARRSLRPLGPASFQLRSVSVGAVLLLLGTRNGDAPYSWRALIGALFRRSDSGRGRWPQIHARDLRGGLRRSGCPHWQRRENARRSTGCCRHRNESRDPADGGTLAVSAPANLRKPALPLLHAISNPPISTSTTSLTSTPCLEHSRQRWRCHFASPFQRSLDGPPLSGSASRRRRGTGSSGPHHVGSAPICRTITSTGAAKDHPRRRHLAGSLLLRFIRAVGQSVLDIPLRGDPRAAGTRGHRGPTRKGPARSRLVIGIALALFAAIAGTVIAPDWGRLPWGAPFLRTSVPPIARPDRSTVIIASGAPLAYLIPSFPPETRFVRIEGNFFLSGATAPLAARLTEVTRKREPDGDFYLMTASDSLAESGVRLLAYSLVVVADSCVQLAPDVAEGVTFCRLEREPKPTIGAS